MKIGILTMFNGVSKIYSLSNIVEQQLEMLLENGYEVRMLVSEGFNDKEKYGIFLDERIEYVKITNSIDGKPFVRYDYTNPHGKLHKSFYSEAEIIAYDFEKALSNVSVCIMHDILYQGWHYVYNYAIRLAQKNLPDTRFIEFTHSFPVNRPLDPCEEMKYRYVPMPNTIFVYPSYSGISALAKQYDVPEGLCRVVYNSISPLENMSDATKNLNREVDLLDSDILVVYPARLTPGKKLEKVAALAGAITSMTDKRVKVVFCDFRSADIEPGSYREAIKVVGESYGLERNDIIFTSEHGFDKGFPHKSVMELFTLSDLYICPSLSESFGLTVIEAASRGNFIVLNGNVPALAEIGKELNAYFMDWDARNCGFDKKVKYESTEAGYLAGNAKRIVQLMRDDRALFAKRKVKERFSQKWIWRNQLEPLINGL